MTTVLVTRPQHQAEPLCQMLQQAGFSVLRLPLIEIEALSLTDDAFQVFSSKPADWIIFISANAVNFALTGNNGKIREYCMQAGVAAIGQATANALQQAGVAVRLLPEQGFDSEALLAMPVLQHLQGQRCVIVRGAGGRELLAETLRARGADVAYLNVYERRQPAMDPLKLIALLQANTPDIIAITSAEALQNLVAQLPIEQWRNLLLNIPLVVISDRLRLIASTLGFKRVAVSDGVSDSAVLKTIINRVSGEYSG